MASALTSVMLLALAGAGAALSCVSVASAKRINNQWQQRQLRGEMAAVAKKVAESGAGRRHLRGWRRNGAGVSLAANQCGMKRNNHQSLKHQRYQRNQQLSGVAMAIGWRNQYSSCVMWQSYRLVHRRNRLAWRKAIGWQWQLWPA